MGHSKCQVTSFAHNDFKLFIVHSQTKVLVELVSCSKPRFLTCLLLTTGHFLLGWTGDGAVKDPSLPHTAVVFFFYSTHKPRIEIILTRNVRFHRSSLLPQGLHLNKYFESFG